MEGQGGGGRGAVTRAVWKRQHLLSFDSLWFGQVNGWLLGFPAPLPVLWNIETDPAEDSWPSEKEGGYLQAESAIEDLGAPQVFPHRPQEKQTENPAHSAVNILSCQPANLGVHFY